jgi:hypothetical protein
MQARQLPNRDYLALKAASRDLIEACGGVTRAAQCTRIAASQLSRACSDHESQFLPVDVVADLEAECGQAIVTGALAALQHLSVTSRPRSVRTSDHVRCIGEVSREFADFVQVQSSAAADGVVDRKESAAALKEIDDLMRVLSDVAELHRANLKSPDLREVS